MNFKLSQHMNKDAVFLVNWSELEGRLEPEYYTPELRGLEGRVREKSSKKLRDYIINIAGGATPSTTKQDKYYTDEENGYPFLRVQNLQMNGEINLENLKFINEKTHKGMLKRSQVDEGDLLVKITGVGRMAIASVAPKGFAGNTNQHMVVIKTGDRKVSEYLAKYLNLDLVERLATRRATGATRPALDYSALKSIPIIEGIDFSILEKSQEEKKKKEAEAEKLQKSIDDYLLNALEIDVPIKDNSIDNRIFKSRFKELAGRRFDPKPYDTHSQKLKKAIEKSKYPKGKLKELIVRSVSGEWGESIESNVNEDRYQKCLVIRATEFDNLYNLKLDNSRTKYRYIKKSKLKKLDIQTNDLLIEKSGGSPDQPVGRIAILREDLVEHNSLCYSNFVHKIRINSSIVLPEYLFNFLKTIHNIKLTEIMQSQTSGIRNLIMSEYYNQSIVIPDKSIQKRISDEINKRRSEAKMLEKEAEMVLEKAKQKIEQIILSE